MTSRRRSRRAAVPRRPRLSHWRADGGPKTRYATEQEANRAALGFRLEYGSDLRAYPCEFCRGWHLGREPEA